MNYVKMLLVNCKRKIKWI